MSKAVVGVVNQQPHNGIWTSGVSDCAVLVVMEWDQHANHWQNFFFEHIAGGDISNANKNQLQQMMTNSNVNNCYAVIGHYFGVLDNPDTSTVFSNIKRFLIAQNVPAENITEYISGMNGMRFGILFFGGLFGEVI